MHLGFDVDDLDATEARVLAAAPAGPPPVTLTDALYGGATLGRAVSPARWSTLPAPPGIDGQVVSLVAYHSCAQIGAGVRGLGRELAAEFCPADSPLADALLCCDMTTGPDGDYVRPADRLVDIRERYGSDDEVTGFGELAASQILATALRKLGRWLDSDSQA